MIPIIHISACALCGKATGDGGLCSTCARDAIQRRALAKPTLLERVLAKFR